MKILNSDQKLALDLFSKSDLVEQFYWTGGTLLAYKYLHHRLSVDIDFFSDEPYDSELVNQWTQNFKDKAGFETLEARRIYDRREFIFNSDERNLKVEFVYYNHTKKPINRNREKFLGVYVDSLEDIAANKTFAFFDRNEPKDLFDLYFLLTKANFDEYKLLALARQKFGVSFTISMFYGEAFKTFALLKNLQPLLLDKSKDKDILSEIEDFFKEKSKNFLEKQLE